MYALETLAIGRPVTRGPISLYPLYTHTPPAERYVTGPMAALQGSVKFDEIEGGRVPILRATNTGEDPVLLLDGETYVGGRQNRSLTVNVLLAPGQHHLPVACVEQGRWDGGDEARRSTRRSPRRVRRVQTHSVHRSLRCDGSRQVDQHAVWRAVESTLEAHAVRSSTIALHDAFDRRVLTFAARPDARNASDELVSMGPLLGQTGVVVAAGRRCLAADMFDRPETLANYWQELLGTCSFDLPRSMRNRPSVDDAFGFVASVLDGVHTSVSGVGLGTEHHFATDRVVAQALTWGDAMVHLSVLALS